MRLFYSLIFAAMIVAGPLRAQTPSVEAYGALPAIEDVVLSPTGDSLAYIRRAGDQSEVVAQGCDGTVLTTVETSDRRIRSVFWASPDHIVIASATTEKVPFFAGRNELRVLDIINVRTQRVARALRASDREAFNAIFGWTVGEYDGQPTLFVEAVTENPADYSFDLYRVDLNTGRGRHHAQGASDTRGYVVRSDGTVAARIAYSPTNGRWRLSTSRGGVWRDIHTVQALLDSPGVLGLGRTSDTVAVVEQGEDDWRMVEVGLTDGADRGRTDLGAAPNGAFQDADGALIGVGFMKTYQDYKFFNPQMTEAWTVLKGALPDKQLYLSSYSDDFGEIVFYVEGTGEPGAYFLYDAAAKRVSLIGRAYPGLTGSNIAEVRIVEYKAADGLDLFGYLTLPPGREPTDLPLVTMPHGGPAARDTAGFDWWAQAMAARGYAVFQPQFRGSDGFGRAFNEAGYGEWGRKMQTDVSDGVRALAERGTIDPDRVCVVGASYGGYVALAGMTLEQDVYRCAVSVAGVSDLRAMLADEQRQGARGDANPSVRYWRRFMGADSASDTAIDAYSPARLADRVKGPILLIHGRQDTVVPFAQSELMARALGSQGQLIALDGEDHFLSTAATRQRMLSATVEFLERHNPPR